MTGINHVLTALYMHIKTLDKKKKLQQQYFEDKHIRLIM